MAGPLYAGPPFVPPPATVVMTCVRGVDLADYLVDRVGDEQVAAAVRGDAKGIAEFRGGGRAVVALVARGAVSGHGGNNRGRR